MEPLAEYGLFANVTGHDKNFREGAKVAIVTVTGALRFKVRGLSIGGRPITTWVSTKKLGNYRAKWVLESKRDAVWVMTKEEAEDMAKRFNH